MILYFTDRQMNIVGQASTNLPEGLTVTDDLMTVDVDTGSAIFECKIHFNGETRGLVDTCAEVGNYILRSGDGENEFYTIIEAEIDTKKQQVYIYAEDAGLDLLNEVVGAYEADKAYPISHYIQMYAADAGFQIGVNEAASLTRKLSWDGEATAQERLLSVATQFDKCEISFSFEVDGLCVVKKFINIYKERGEESGIQLRLNQDIDSIVTTKSIANLATALQCTGGTPDSKENEETGEFEDQPPVTLAGYSYDDGDFYVDGTVLKSRKALERWSRVLWKNDKLQFPGGHITKQYSYDTLSQSELCKRAITELKKIRDMEVNYEAELEKLPDNVKVGDRVNIIDDAGELYLSTRILTLEKSVADQTNRAVLGEYLIKGSGISEKVAHLAAQFAKSSQSAARALTIANNAKTAATAAQGQADSAVADAAEAQTAADAAKAAADTASQSAAAAQAAAANAQAAVDVVEEDVAGLETTVANAQAAADAAQAAAETAQTKATEAHTAATNAQTKADNAATAAGTAQAEADNAKTAAATAQSAADKAVSDAEAASTTAAAAKLDAENAQAEIDALGDSLTTLSNTMTADYARKTDLTETEACLQTQITQNAAGISSNASKIVTIDETANSAKETAESAQTAAQAAKTQADTAAADAAAAQTAADNAATAAGTAQAEADNAKTAAATAQGVADKAKADLEAAKADLATVTGRVDATEADITAAQEAVTAAQAAADAAQADATAAATAASSAQTKADTAATNAAAAQTAANDAASKANLAQAAADEAKGDAAAAQTKADEAAAAATAAQNTANTAKTNAATAQSTADAAATAAATAQQAADDADAKAAAAAADLVTAQNNLAAVTSRVDATEEDVAAAQAAVTAAQTAADAAAANAATAQSTADTAKANAAAAQTAANTAKAAADAAQADATAAQEAADAAQADVNALAVRVTSAETDISQNAEQIALRATKTEVAETLGGYYTKEQTDAAITVKANEITSTVSSTYATKQEVNAIEIGGRNLLLNTDTLSKWFRGAGSLRVDEEGDAVVDYPGADAIRWFDLNCMVGDLVQDVNMLYGHTITFSFWVKVEDGDNWGTVGDGAGFYISISACAGSDSLTRTKYRLLEHRWRSLESGKWTRLVYTIAVEDESFFDSGSGDVGAFFVQVQAKTTIPYSVKKLKLEYGNKPTDWTPAPEDGDTSALGIGGRNLYLGTKTFDNTRTDEYTWESHSLWTVADETYEDFIVLKKSTNWGGFYQIKTFKKDEIYTLSFYAKVDSGGTITRIFRDKSDPSTELANMRILAQSHGSSQALVSETQDGTAWTRYWITVQATADIEQVSLRIENAINGKVLYLCGFKLEKGNRATDWTPAPEDTENEIAEAIDKQTRNISSQIQQTADQITQTVSETYATKDSVQETVSASTELLSDSFTVRLEKLQEKTDANTASAEETREQFQNLSQYMRYGGGVLELGDSSSPILLQHKNDRIQFVLSDGTVQSLWTPTTWELTNLLRFRLGPGVLVVQPNGSISGIKAVD